MKKILIIGASTGIGLALAKQLDNEGNKVIGTYNSNPIANSGSIEYHQLDVSQDFSLDFLPDELDGVVYCLGAIDLAPFKRIKLDSFKSDFNLQVLGAINVIQQSLKSLKKGKSPSILMFSTVAVQKGYNFHSQVAVSKGAIEGLTRSLAAELAPTIRVNAIAPSLTDTPLAAKLLSSDQKRSANAERHPLKRIGMPEDIAEMANFLLSDQASWITGQILHVDGGKSSVTL